MPRAHVNPRTRPASRADAAGAAVSVPATRTDRADLGPPRQLANGSKVYHAWLVGVGDVLSYAWGDEIVTREAISTPDYLAGLKGLPLLAQHLPGTPDVRGAGPRDGQGRNVGAVLDAAFDESAQKVRVSIVVHEPADQQLVGTAYKALSEQYTPTLRTGPGGRSEQIGRVSNHVALVPAGRSPSADVRSDNLTPGGAVMTVEEMFKQLLEAIAKLGKADAQNAELQADVAEQTARADAAEQSVATKAAELAKVQAVEIVATYRRADDLGHKIPAGLGAVEARAALARAIRPELRADAGPEYVAAVIDLASPQAKPAAAAFGSGEVRADGATNDTNPATRARARV